MVMVMNRTSFLTQEKLTKSTVPKIRRGRTLKMGNPHRESRTLSHMISLRFATKKIENEANGLKTDEVKAMPGSVGTKCIKSLHSVDIIVFCAYIFLFLTFNCVYFSFFVTPHCN
jgi:hypothetical protein